MHKNSRNRNFFCRNHNKICKIKKKVITLQRQMIRGYAEKSRSPGLEHSFDGNLLRVFECINNEKRHLITDKCCTFWPYSCRRT